MTAEAPAAAAVAATDIVVGLTSFNDGDGVGDLTRGLASGLRGLVPTRGCLVLADAGSKDATVAQARAAAEGCAVVEVVEPLAGLAPDLPYHGVPARARLLRGILTTARDRGAAVCVALDAGGGPLQAGWLEALVAPIRDHGLDFAVPWYRRRPHEAALIKGLVYPMTRALYGAPVRQPATGEFACSGALAARLLDEKIWERDGAHAGIALWVTTAAVAGGASIGQVALGPRAHRIRAGAPLDVATTVTQVVGALFGDIDARATVWQRTRGLRPVRSFGEPVPAMDVVHGVDPEPLVEAFRLGYRELRDIWARVLPAKSIVELGRLMQLPATRFAIDEGLWARIAYDFALGYRLHVLAREHLLQSLAPLYLGWLASYVVQTRGASAEEADEHIERVCAAFDAHKSYMIARWRWPDRLRA